MSNQNHSATKTRAVNLRFIGWSVLAFGLVLAAVLGGYRNLRHSTEERLEENVDSSIASMRTSLNATHRLYSERILAAIRVLRRLAADQGPPQTDAPILVGDHRAPNLRFGDHRIGLDYTLVDETVELMGGTATIFSRAGGDFVRISTNVQKADGSRAVGTVLDPNGAAYRAIINDESYYGVVDILGRPYITAYEPIHDATGATIGIYYVGYLIETLGVISADLADTPLLDHGFFALVDHKGAPLFPVRAVDQETLLAAADHALTDNSVTSRWRDGPWQWHAESFPSWGFTLLAAVYTDDIQARSLRSALSVFGLMAPMLLVALLVAYFGTRRLQRTLDESQRLRAEADRLSVVASRTYNGVVITDAHGVVEWINDGFTRITGYTAADMIGHHPDEVLLSTSADPATIAAKNEARQAGRGFQVELLNTRKDGAPVWLLIDGQPMKDTNGTLAGYVVVQVDITQRKEEEVELRTAQSAAEEANRAKSAFLANMSHELRTPLNAIIGYTEMLIEKAQFSGHGDTLPDLQKVEAAGNHLLGLINDVLDLSKIEAGKMTLYLEEFALPTMIEEVRATIQPLMARNDNEFIIECDPDLGLMRADITKLRQTLFNLLSNAAKFTQEGAIRLRVFSPDNDPNRLAFEVSDTGIGMTSAQLSRLFQAFSQADDSTTRKYGGTGLGLVISRKFCLLMGGDITVTSEPGEGTVFTAWLPRRVHELDPGATRAPFSVAPTASAAVTTPAAAGAPLILVVDDDPVTIDLLTRHLTREGYAVIATQNGREALELARSRHPQLITLDVMMPSMDGWSVLSALKADARTHTIPVVMVSMIDDRQLGYTLGVADYLTKPVDRTRLLAALQRHAPRGQLHRALIIDDLENNRAILRTVLEQEGWQTLEAADGLAGLEVFGQHHPSLILLDLMMPEMDGFEFVRELRQREDGRTVPVIVVTAKDLTADERDRLRAGVENIVQKGAVNPAGLLAEIRDKIAHVHDHT